MRNLPSGFCEHWAWVDREGGLWTCGRGTEGQLGHGSYESISTLKRVSGLPPCAMVAVGERFTVCVTRDGRLFCFGAGGQGQLGQNRTHSLSTPHQVLDLPPIRSVACGADFVLCIAEDSSVWAFGNNKSGQLGLAHRSEYVLTPCRLPSIQARQVACGIRHTLILSLEGELFGCGSGRLGELGNQAQSSTTLVPISVPTQVSTIHCGARFSIIRATDSTLWSTGYDEHGQLGRGKSSPATSEFHRIPDIVATQVSCGYEHVMAIDNEHNLWAWGLCLQHLGPRPTLMHRGVSVVQAGSRNSVVCTKDGEWCVQGTNSCGQLALGHTDPVRDWTTLPPLSMELVIPTVTEETSSSSSYLNSSMTTSEMLQQLPLRPLRNEDPPTRLLSQIVRRGLEGQHGGQHEEARQCYEAILQAKTFYEVDDNLLNTVLSHLGTLCLEEGLYKQAESHFLTVLRPREETSLTVETYGHLGLLYWKEGRYRESRRYFATGILLAEKLDSEPRIVAELYSNYGLSLASRGQVQKAVSMFRKALVINTDLYGDDSAPVATCLSNMATELYHMGLFTEATTHFRTALDLRATLFGKRSKQYATTLINFAFCRYEESQYRKAESMLRKALNIRQAIFGNDSINLVAAMDRLGQIYQDLGKHDQAMQCFQRTEVIRSRCKREKSLQAAVSHILKASLLLECDQLDAAEELLRCTIELFLSLDNRNKHLATAQLVMARLLEAREDLDQASYYLDQARDLREALFDEDSPEIMEVYSHLAALRAKQGLPIEADSLYDQAAKAFDRIYGESSLKVAQNLNDWALLHLDRGFLGTARDLILQAMVIQRNAVGEESKQMALSFHNLGLVTHALALKALQELEDPEKKHQLALDEAKRHLERAAAINRTIFGTESKAYANNLDVMAEVYRTEGREAVALCLSENALALRTKIFQTGRVTAPTHLRMASMYLKAGNLRTAREHLAKALAPLTLEEPRGTFEDNELEVREAEQRLRALESGGASSAECMEGRLQLVQLYFRYCCFVSAAGTLSDILTARHQRDQTGSEETRRTYFRAIEYFNDYAEELEDIAPELVATSLHSSQGL